MRRKARCYTNPGALTQARTLRPRRDAQSHPELVLSRSRGRGLEQASIGQRHAGAVADNEVIQQPHVDQIERILDPARNELIGLTWFGHSGRVVMGQDYRCGIALERLFHDLAGVDGGIVDRAAKQLIKSQHPVAIVQKQAAEHLMGPIPEPGQ